MNANVAKRYNFEFWDAIDGKLHQFTPEENKLFTNSEIHKYNVHVGAVKSVCLNNLNLWKYSFNNNTNLVILEDDVIMTSPAWLDFEEMFKDNFDIHFLSNQKNHANCYAYMVTPQGASKLIKHFTTNGFKDQLDNDLRWLDKSQFKVRHEITNHFGTFSPHGSTNYGSDLLLEGNKSHIKT